MSLPVVYSVRRTRHYVQTQPYNPLEVSSYARTEPLPKHLWLPFKTLDEAVAAAKEHTAKTQEPMRIFALHDMGTTEFATPPVVWSPTKAKRRVRKAKRKVRK